MAKLVRLLEQHINRQPPTVVIQATTWWETALVYVMPQECGLGVNLPVKVCCNWSFKYVSSKTASQGTETYANELRLSFVFHVIVPIAKQLQNSSKKVYVRLCSRSVSVDMNL